MKTLKPIVLKPEFYERIEKEINNYFKEVFFYPMQKILSSYQKGIFNSTSSLISAINDGTIQYVDGKFIGKYNSKTTKDLLSLKAKYNKRSSSWSIAVDDLPIEVRVSLADSATKFEKMHKEVISYLDKIDTNKVNQLKFEPVYQYVLEDIDNDIKTAEEAVGVIPNMSPEAMNAIALEYSNNLKLYIKEFTNKNILQLRKEVLKNTFSGYRAEALVKDLQINYNVSMSKAKFLARQETSLLMSKFRETRYKDAGVTRYKWSTAHDSRVRDRHQELDGKIFSWDSPPIIDENGNRGHAGEAFACFPEESKIDFAYGVEKCFQRWYSGKLTEIVMSSGKTLRATPNHQVLTTNGWKPIGSLNNSDNLIDLSEKLIIPFKNNKNNSVSTISEIYQSISKKFFGFKTIGSLTQFHGDGSNNDVNIIDTTRNLRFNRITKIIKNANKFFFAYSNSFAFRICNFNKNIRNSFFNLFSPCFVSRFCNTFKFFFSGIFETGKVCFASIPNGNISINQSFPNNVSTKIKPFSNRKFTFSKFISFNNFNIIKFNKIMWFSSNPSIGYNSKVSKMFGKIVGTHADNVSDLLESFSRIQKIDRVVNNRSIDFSGHVYNLQTKKNWYCCNGIVVHNCRCVAIPIVD